jgi:hypothetical protein
MRPSLNRSPTRLTTNIVAVLVNERCSFLSELHLLNAPDKDAVSSEMRDRLQIGLSIDQIR